MKIIALALILASNLAKASAIPNVKIEYSFGLDMYCPLKVEPEILTEAQAALIPKIPVYRLELLDKLGWFQSQWTIQGRPLLTETVKVIGKPFPMGDLQAAVFLCPRFPFMGTPLAFNMISYLDSSAKDIASLGTPMPTFFFISTAFHEILHKYIDNILNENPSNILKNTNASELYKAHLHLFALQKTVFESIGSAGLLTQIGKLEATHGPDYARAWQAVHGDPEFSSALLSELMN